MNESILRRIKTKLKEIFTKLIRLCQRIANKLPDNYVKVTILQQLKKAKEKLNDVNKMTVENGEKMAEELKTDAENIEKTIKRTMDKVNEKRESRARKSDDLDSKIDAFEDEFLKDLKYFDDKFDDILE